MQEHADALQQLQAAASEAGSALQQLESLRSELTSLQTSSAESTARTQTLTHALNALSEALTAPFELSSVSPGDTPTLGNIPTQNPTLLEHVAAISFSPKGALAALLAAVDGGAPDAIAVAAAAAAPTVARNVGALAERCREQGEMIAVLRGQILDSQASLGAVSATLAAEISPHAGPAAGLPLPSPFGTPDPGSQPGSERLVGLMALSEQAAIVMQRQVRLHSSRPCKALSHVGRQCISSVENVLRVKKPYGIMVEPRLLSLKKER